MKRGRRLGFGAATNTAGVSRHEMAYTEGREPRRPPTPFIVLCGCTSLNTVRRWGDPVAICPGYRSCRPGHWNKSSGCGHWHIAIVHPHEEGVEICRTGGEVVYVSSSGMGGKVLKWGQWAA